MKQLALIFSLFTLSLFMGCIEPDPIRVDQFGSLTFKGFSDKKANFEVELSIENPNFFEITLKKTTLEVLINEVKIGVISIDEPISFEGNKTATKQFLLAFDPKESLSNSLALTVNILTQKQVDMEISGTALIEGMFVEKEVEIKEHKTVPLIKE